MVSVVRENPGEGDAIEPTRMIAIGSAALVEGFALVGFEIYPDAGEKELELVLNELVRHNAKALVLLESDLARCDCPVLQYIRSEYVRVVVVEIPQLHAPCDFHPQVEQLVLSVLGPEALEPKS